jgi:thiol-disulfide isomerase/thioredoxin
MASKTNFAWDKGKYLVYFTSPNCGYCQSFSSTWDDTVDQLKTTAPHINALKVNVEDFDIASVSPEVYGYPTIRAYRDGKMLDDFEEDRTETNLLNFAKKHLGDAPSQTGGGKSKRRQGKRPRSSRRRRRRTHQRGGMAPVSSFVGAPMDTRSSVPPAQQSVDAMTSMAPPAPHGGLYHPSAPPANGGWGSIPVPATAAGYTHNNLRSANPPPGATEQYMTAATNRPGNSYSAKPGVYNYKDGTTYALKCTNGARGGRRCGRRTRRTRRRGGRLDYKQYY